MWLDLWLETVFELFFRSCNELVWMFYCFFVTFCTSRILVMHVCVSVFPLPHSHTTARTQTTWGNGRDCPLLVHYWADLQSVHRFRCYDNIAPNTKCHWVLVLALCLVLIVAVCNFVLRILVPFSPATCFHLFIMAALWNRAGHYIFILWFLSSSFFLA